MLVLSCKIGERIVVLHRELAVTVIAVEGKAVRLGISATEDSVLRLPSTPGNGRIKSGLATERLFMSGNHGASGNRDIPLENIAAELASAAYSFALRHGMRCSWIEMELALWRALAETVKKWARERPPAGSSVKVKIWRQGLVEELIGEAFHVALRHGEKWSHREIEWNLDRTLRSVIEGIVGRPRYAATPTAAAGGGSSPR